MSQYSELKERLQADPRRWAVTGAAGFIAGHIVETLLGLGQRVVGLDNFSTGKRANLEMVQAAVGAENWERFTFVEGDIREPADCKKACESADYVLHLAAMGSVPASMDDPRECDAINVRGTLNMLLAARESGVRRLVYSSSSAVYGDEPSLPAVEGVIGRPLSPYAASKRIDEIYAETMQTSFGFDTNGLRYFNIFGARQDPNGPYAAVIPIWAKAMANGETLYINGDGENTRDFCHVSNVVQANLLAATVDEPQAVNQVYNIGLGERTSLNELYNLLRENVLRERPDTRIPEPVYRDFRPGDIRHSFANTEKARNALGFHPETTLSDGLRKSVRWYLENL